MAKEWHPKLLYFTVNMMAYAVYTLQAQFLVLEWGLGIRDVGFLSALMGINFAGAIAWSRLADYTGHHKRILMACSASYAIMYCGLLVRFDEKTVFKTVWIALILAASNIAYSAIFPLLDSRVLAMLADNRNNINNETSNNGDKQDFGKQRVWGTLGHALITVISTEVVGLTGFEGMFAALLVYTVLFVGAVWWCIPAHPQHVYYHVDAASSKASLLFNGLFDANEDLLEEGDLENCYAHVASQPEPNHHHYEPPVTGPPQDPATKEQPSSITVVLLKDTRFLALMALVVSAGYTRAIMTFFQPFYVAIVLGKGYRFVSWAIAGRVVSESATYYFAQEVHARVGNEWMLMIGEALGLLRVGGYAFINPRACTFPVVLCLELLKGASTSLTMTAAVMLAADLAPPGGAATAQGIYSGAWQGLSMAMGGLFGAILARHHAHDGTNGLKGLFADSFWALLVIFGMFLGRAAVGGHLRHPITRTGL